MPTRDENRRFWNDEYDWSDGGESWTPDETWRREVLAHTLEKHLAPGAEVLEIGPGAGRFTAEVLAASPKRLVLVDLAQRCLDLCRERFGELDFVEYHLNDGRSLDFLGDESIDFVWSFDVFVHVDADDLAAYVEQFRRIMRPGAIGILHYASIDRAQCEDPREGWRAQYTSGEMFDCLAANDFELVEDLYSPHISHTNSSVVIFRR